MGQYGTVFVVGKTRGIEALNPRTLTPQWTLPPLANHPVKGTSSTKSGFTWYDDGIASPDGALYLEQMDEPMPDALRSTLVAVDQVSGRVRWRLPCHGAMQLAPRPGQGVYLLMESENPDDAHLYRIDARSGRKRWSYRSRAFLQDLAADPRGEVYLVSAPNDTTEQLSCRDGRTGRFRWRFRPAVPGNTVSLFASQSSRLVFWVVGSRLYAVDSRTGHLRWSTPLADTNARLPMAEVHGTLYVNEGEGKACVVKAVDEVTGRRLPRDGVPYEMVAASASGILYCQDTRFLPGQVIAWDTRTRRARWMAPLPAVPKNDWIPEAVASPGGTLYLLRGGRVYAFRNPLR